MRYLVFDLETCAIDDAETYIPPSSAPDNYKDPEKIARYTAEADAKARDGCALDPDLCRIVTLAWTFADGSGLWVEPCRGEATEREVLTAFWAEARGCQYVGYNCLGFDLPVLLRRSLYLDVDAPKIQLDRYRHPEVIDLQSILSNCGQLKWRSLSFYVQRFGLPPVEDDVTGADIPRLVAEEQWDVIQKHCRADVLRTKYLAQRIKAIPYLFSTPEPAVF